MYDNRNTGAIKLKVKVSVDKKVPVSVRLDVDIVAQIDEIAESSGYKRSEIINKLLRSTVFNVVVSQ